MANFTELHLNNPQDPKKSRNTNVTKSLSKEKALFGAGLIAVTAVSGVFLLITNGCSKGSKAASDISAPAPVSPSVTTPAPVVAAVQPPAVAPKPAKKRVQRKAPMVTFTEPAYGVSFKYPKSYILKTGDEPELDLAGLGPVMTNFVQPGAVTVAAIELPRSSYPGTDFTSAYFGMSVNSSLSPEQCEQFAFPKSEHPENEPGSVSKVKLAGTEYTMIEDQGTGSGNREARLKYFHHFESGNCYEFSMGLGTVDDTVAGLKPVNRSLVFGRMEQILASVKLQQVSVQKATVPEIAKDAPVHTIVEGSKE
ncbi:MAG TPA: hypothetical protein VLL05_09280 [Terriglobales bacterium]|nr:hypothetical protein [Terriglobales bacterium]